MEIAQHNAQLEMAKSSAKRSAEEVFGEQKRELMAKLGARASLIRNLVSVAPAFADSLATDHCTR